MGGLVAISSHVNFNMFLDNSDMKISVLLPTRGRGKLAKRSLLSLINNSSDPTGIEYLIALDDDDVETIKYFEKEIVPILDKSKSRYSISGHKRLGYINLHQYLNNLAPLVKGDWIMFWNDDAVMKTKGWDEKIIEHTGKFRVLRMQENSQHPYAIFPIVPYDWYALFGHLSNHQMTDAQISQIAYLTNIMQNIDVHCIHDRFDLTGNNNDETYKNRPQQEGNLKQEKDLNSIPMVLSRYKHCERILWYLKKTGDYNDHFYKSVTGKEHPWIYLEENDPNNLTGSFYLKDPSKKYVRKPRKKK